MMRPGGAKGRQGVGAEVRGSNRAPPIVPPTFDKVEASAKQCMTKIKTTEIIVETDEVFIIRHRRAATPTTDALFETDARRVSPKLRPARGFTRLLVRLLRRLRPSQFR